MQPQPQTYQQVQTYIHEEPVVRRGAELKLINSQVIDEGGHEFHEHHHDHHHDHEHHDHEHYDHQHHDHQHHDHQVQYYAQTQQPQVFPTSQVYTQTTSPQYIYSSTYEERPMMTPPPTTSLPTISYDITTIV